MPDISCAEVIDALPDLLSAPSGPGSEQVLAHLGSCPTCAAEWAATREVVEGMSNLFLPTRPPHGFTERTEARLAAVRGASAGPVMDHRVTARRRTWPRLAAAAAAAAVLVAAGAAGEAAISRRPAPSPMAAAVADGRLGVSADLRSGVTVVGSVTIYAGSQPWLAADVRHMPSAPTVGCVARLRSGQVISVGTFSLHSGSGQWAAALPTEPAQIAEVELRGVGGARLAAASFPPW